VLDHRRRARDPRRQLRDCSAALARLQAIPDSGGGGGGAGGRPRRSQSISAQSGVKWRRPGGLSAAEVSRYVPAI